MKKQMVFAASGAAAGAINGLFGGGGGMVFLPCLVKSGLQQKKAFATCVAVILPICAVSAFLYLLRVPFDWLQALPYLVGGAIGGAVGGKTFGRVSTRCIRQLFALFMLYGGVRYLL